MDRFSALQAFVQVAQDSSFTQAALRLRLTKSAVSKSIGQLETELGVRLVNRTTRQVSLTPAGAEYLESARRILSDMAEADQAVRCQHLSLSGRLRLSAPVGLTARHLAPILPRFLERHPELELDIDLNDRLVDLVAEGFDVALRVGRLSDSTLLARRIAGMPMVAAASPAYVAARGMPRQPMDLAQHSCLAAGQVPAARHWSFTDADGHKQSAARIVPRLTANNGEVLRAAMVAGLGVGLLPAFYLADDLAAGRLVPVLPGWSQEPTGIFAIYPPTRQPSAKVRSFIDFLVESLTGQPGLSAGD